jgi:RES domain-containing protein
LRHVHREGVYFRVCDPDWTDCGDTSHNRRMGGRWNPRGRFGALYLNATREVAAANARVNFAGEMHLLHDLRPEYRPDLQSFEVPAAEYLDAVTPEGVAELGLPAGYPGRVGWRRCQAVGLAAYEAGEPGVACRSAAEADAGDWVGEELALFDRGGAGTGARPRRRLKFSRWYPE